MNRLICFEGIDGSGKSTHSKLLAEHLSATGQRVVRTAEPTSGPIGTDIRARLMAGEISPALPFLFSADRAEHVAQVIGPSLAQEKWVVTDRYYFSTMAYQSAEYDIQWLWALNKGFPMPGLVIYLDTPLKACLERLESRQRDAFENADFIQDLQRRYDTVLSKYMIWTNEEVPIIRVSGSGEKNDVAARVLDAVRTCFPDA